MRTKRLQNFKEGTQLKNRKFSFGLLVLSAGAVIAAALALSSNPARAGSDAWSPVTGERLLNAAKDDGWLMYLRTYNSQAYVPFDQVNTGNVAKLKEVWSYSIPIKNGFEAPPIVNGREMIVTTPLNHVLAFDAVSGNLLWKYDYPLNKLALRTVCCDVVNRGVALYGNNAYLKTLDNHVIALDARTGKVVWNHTVYHEPGVGYFMTGAPLIVDNRLIVGIACGEYGGRGFLVALDPNTGKQLWKTYTVPAPGEPGGDTWPAGRYEHGGGATWTTGSYDPETDTLFWGVGNPGPWLSSERKGKNLYTDSILALDPKTGHIKWYYQATPNDPWDYDGVNVIVLADITYEGKSRKVLYQANRNGWFIVLDRTNGKFIYAKPFLPKVTSVTGYSKDGEPTINEANKPDVGKEVFTCPAFFGGTNWWAPSFDPHTGYAYVPTELTCMKIAGKSPAPFKAGLGYLNESFEVQPMPDTDGWGELQAIDVATGNQVWKHVTKMPWNDGTLSTAGGLVFSGTPDRKFYAFDAKTGKILWEHQMSSGVIGQPVSFMVGGKQYIAVQAGWGGVSPLWGGPKMVPMFKNIPLGGRVYIFALKSPSSRGIVIMP